MELSCFRFNYHSRFFIGIGVGNTIFLFLILKNCDLILKIVRRKSLVAVKKKNQPLPDCNYISKESFNFNSSFVR